ncbi:hypothetical protein FOIG_16702 [Fusarium odoratissimum NRRL 54006]|uniref:Endonuclease/exonuclease/phosphatase domain-containing protein n=2 Tax=Fusarium oxysporum species complex TaxID=171631 RepID=X0J0W2_FUSO5|nr:uncharacterized protein FOIG_16702 [Fusarium odoratissimum NRRL 54006]EXL90016.1 hypothetical protein FOIG_16702 [Fusarium odoratissimum NRRL 54006]TXB96509.1 hypothetical protein FocTR4_00012047 [Fusarium oxysporum f. sp. cubense]
MATPWPQDEIWPTDYREHATNLSKYLQKALSAIDNGDGLPVASRGVRVALIRALTLIVKMQSIPDLGHVYEAEVNKAKAASKSRPRWHFREASRDLCSLNLVLGTEEEQQIMIHNVYNPIKTATERGSMLPLLELAIERSSHHEQIIVGDFNLYHELWGGDRVQRADHDAAELTIIMEDYCLTSNLAPGTIIYEECDGRTTIDLCLTTAGLMDRLI